jgi:hypothetical protein
VKSSFLNTKIPDMFRAAGCVRSSKANMKFTPGDTTDSEHCTALKHEFLRCEDAFKDFETYGTLMILKAQAEAKGTPPTSPHEKRLIAYKTYNA